MRGVSKPEKFARAAGTEKNEKSTYTYVIVGGGTSGAVLASRLSEDPTKKVIVIEAGGSDQSELMSKAPAGFGNLFKTSADWDYSTVPQKHVDNKELFHPRGKMLGGCSSINAMCYQHCSSEDYDKWEKLGATGWGWDDLAPFFKKSEDYTPNSKFPIDESHRGKGGVMKTSHPYTNDLSLAFIEAATEIGIPANTDINRGRDHPSTGVMRYTALIDKNGQRSSTSSAFLTKDVTDRKNLSVLTNTMATRIIFEGTKAVGIEVGQEKDGKRWIIDGGEIILALGAFGTPQLLMVSGVGPADELKELNIPVVNDLPVGKGLKDHILSSMVFKVDKGSSLQFLASPIGAIPSLIKWLWNGSGPLGTNVAEAAIFTRSTELPGGVESCKTTNASGSSSPDIQFICAPLQYVHHGFEKPKIPSDDFMTFGPIMLQPYSEGTVKIASASVFDKAIVDPNYLADQRDIELMRAGIKFSIALAKQKSLAKVIHHSTVPEKADEMTDAEIDAHVRATCATLYHPLCTASIGKVVDTKLKVFGTENLRVCDGSVMPSLVSGHPVAAVIALSELFAHRLISGTA